MKEVSVPEDTYPDGIEVPRNPVLVNRDQLDELKGKASDTDKDYEEMKESFEEMTEAQERVEELESQVDELQAKADAVDEVKGTYAEELSSHGILDKEDYMEMDVANLRSKVSDIEKGEEGDPAPNGNPANPEELQGNEDNAEEIAQLRENIEWYEERDWDSNAKRARKELEELTE